MAKMTKAQQKRMVRDIMVKAQKLFMAGSYRANWPKPAAVSAADMQAIEKLTTKWLKRLG